MSKAARILHRQQRRTRHSADEHIVIVVGWCLTEDDLAEVRKGIHDALIKLMGDRRTGGVSWRQYTGSDATEVLVRLKEGAGRDELEHYRRCSALLREYGGWLVAASAPGVAS
jgi:hypothetical protein